MFSRTLLLIESEDFLMGTVTTYVNFVFLRLEVFHGDDVVDVGNFPFFEFFVTLRSLSYKQQFPLLV